MLLPNFLLSLFAFCFLIFDFCCAYPTSHSYTSTVFSRQETTLTSPVTVTQTQKITTGAGTFIQTCNITFTPTVVNGVDMVREEKTCVVTPDNGNSGVPSAVLPPASSTIVSTLLPSPTSPSLTTTSDLLSSTSTGILPSTDGLSSTGVPSSTVLPEPTVTGLPPSGSGSVLPPVISLTLTFVPQPSGSNSVSPVPSSVVVPSSGGSNPTAAPQPENTDSLPDTTGTSTLALPSAILSPSPSPTATSENAGAPTPFDPPGKKLEVLPIGLGVFAGVSVIALFVVGIVTWERTKHRRNFRKRRQLEEANNRMGYGTV